MLMVTGDWMMIIERVGRRRAVLQARPARDEATTFLFIFGLSSSPAVRLGAAKKPSPSLFFFFCYTPSF